MPYTKGFKSWNGGEVLLENWNDGILEGWRTCLVEI